MTQTIVSAIVAALASIVGIAARNTRRTRLRHKAEAYAKLASEVEEKNPEAGAALRALVNDIIGTLVAEETKALRTRLHTTNLIATIAVITVGGALIAAAWSVDTVWIEWPLYIIGVALILFALIGGATQLRVVPEEGTLGKA